MLSRTIARTGLVCHSASLKNSSRYPVLPMVQWSFPSGATCVRTKVTKPQPQKEINLAKQQSSILQEGTGKIYDKKPFKFRCVEGKSYLWCICGWSKSQPFCDGTHKNPHMKIKFRPVRFIPAETKEFLFCNCKQTKNRPFCDGTHKNEEIQAAVKS